ncbi:MAG TPA: hypothetical protein VEX68_09205 [Bryobacteraceae bacterium]|nr:hypothetical protein [Bryobacteraceae bacterium]
MRSGNSRPFTFRKNGNVSFARAVTKIFFAVIVKVAEVKLPLRKAPFHHRSARLLPPNLLLASGTGAFVISANCSLRSGVAAFPPEAWKLFQVMVMDHMTGIQRDWLGKGSKEISTSGDTIIRRRFQPVSTSLLVKRSSLVPLL